MLSEDTEHNEQKQNKNSHNLLIQGDNLEVLKHLKGAYSEKIKMIGGVLKSMLTLNEAIIDVKEG
ncbi:hypothetical protein [Acinetobacter johnsonii]|uniref:Uncharacterized protein n=1 Tax=Acinetobacter johnsonii TaxID=40214 RepID=A0AA42MUI0_ACIJO|nr:hypothetical protein [Acinetobacter johnsonii]MDH0970080.1 hypothetical protein [Acinetobacter johnsonii]QQT94584.1 hypothetical protein I6I51_07835 [Acinetobacter johnsonii]QYA54581.1 hypothetical protein EGT72_012235 [Acinetobacter johnsonii]WQN46808.1 hypothetical protein TQH59_12880 [Acinetobacter johnsonii]